MNDKKYELSIDPSILELLGPSLYTNIYYILAELIANAYDADARNVYIFSNKDDITVEDDGKGMSYINGDIRKYLSVAEVSRNNEHDALTETLKRKKMGRKGVGKLAALSVSENVSIKTIFKGEKSGFILSRRVNEDRLLTPITDENITFNKITNSGTAVVMENPQYKLHSTLKAVKRNLLKIFPLVDESFKIHLICGSKEEVIKDFDKEMIEELSALITLGDDFAYLNQYFKTKFESKKNELLKNQPVYSTPISMKDRSGNEHSYNVEVRGWIGTYSSTKGRKATLTDFPDNFISLYANHKMGEFNILPKVGQNKLPEVYVVGQLHADIFELTELPDMALSNRQGYKSDDLRYQTVLNYVRNTLLPEILKMRKIHVDLNKKEKKAQKIAEQRKNEEDFRQSVDTFRKKTSKKAANKISRKLGINESQIKEVEDILANEINANSPDMGIKSIIDSQKKKILISQTRKDKDLADVIYEMLIYNNVPPEDIIYTNCDDEKSRIPEGYRIYDYLRTFFVDSYSTQKMCVFFVTSENTRKSWGALTEIGAAWITGINQQIFNIEGFRPEHPLEDEKQWHTTRRNKNGDLSESELEQDIFCQKIEFVCEQLGYDFKSREKNKKYLSKFMEITEN